MSIILLSKRLPDIRLHYSLLVLLFTKRREFRGSYCNFMSVFVQYVKIGWDLKLGPVIVVLRSIAIKGT